MEVEEIKDEAIRCSITETTLQRAKQSLGVESKRTGFGKNGKWSWSLPVAVGQIAPQAEETTP